MCCSQLSVLKEILSDQQIRLLQEYFSLLTPKTFDKITASKVSMYLDISHDLSRKVLMKCKKEGILDISYGIRCPSCGALIKKVDDCLDIDETLDNCYVCGEANQEITSENVDLIFRLLINPKFFNLGQQSDKVMTVIPSYVAPQNALYNYVEDKSFDLNKELFLPDEHEYVNILGLCQNVKESITKKEKGESLERLAIYLFNLCKIFKAAGIRTELNQIDCYVRNKLFVPCGIFKTIGSRIIIECKNENVTPSGSYISKLHSIITEINSNGTLIQCGIIFSKQPPPSTYKEHAVKYYLHNKVIVLSMCLKEIKELAEARGNLLDFIEQKSEEIILDATSDLKVAGLY